MIEISDITIELSSSPIHEGRALPIVNVGSSNGTNTDLALVERIPETQPTQITPNRFEVLKEAETIQQNTNWAEVTE
ncbi:hypothetical protein FRX31_017060 [Thalictrum thalictroides]|uniref:Uncharacterized protein n=1 Tax=Thalictrum thalictroides TaxID=46969 RepID=A0A7J6WAY0_THATH|nr:hypothetical protein FRX31_017060 [Thalictrum thalictroides]